MKIKPIPNDYQGVIPYLIINGAAKAIKFYKKAFGATEFMSMPGPGGKVMHAEIRVRDIPIMLADEFPEMGASSPKSIGGTPVYLMIYVKDVDAIVAKAKKAGATIVKPVQDQFYGDRSGTVKDPFGHLWTFATHIEDVSNKELKKRMDAMCK